MAKQPVREFKATHNAKVVIWDNEENGLAIKIVNPSYKTGDGTYKESAFWVNDLPSIHFAIWQAMMWLAQNEEELRREGTL